MYQCKNCGGNLRFDIGSQRLVCDYCKSDYDCYEFPEDTTDPSSYEVNVFSCPQCGGEIMTTDQSVADFCSYCGSSVVFGRRLSREKRPSKIIPFKKSVEDCRTIYRNKLKRALFAPGQLKDPGFLERFRGIYIPYWSYGFHQKGLARVTGTKEYSKGNYDYTDYYTISGELDSDYTGICYDASSTLDDEISGSVGPFDPKDMQDFTPAYLSGFYADVADVDADLYLDDANRIANEETVRVISRDPKARRYDIVEDTSLAGMNEQLHTTIDQPQGAMLPLWFLTWRDRDRVAYMTVNGQTGKIYADIPVDIRKYILAAVLCAIPFFLAFNMLLSLTASTSLLISGLIAFAAAMIYYKQILSIVDHDRRVHDRGYQTRNPSEKEPARAKKKKGEKEKSFLKRHEGSILVAVWGIFILVIIFRHAMTGSILSAIFSRITWNILLVVMTVSAFLAAHGARISRNIDIPMEKEMAGSLAAVLIAAVINLVHPVSDLYYYGGMILACLGSFSTIIQIIRRYNLLVTRPIPDLHQRGGGQA